MILQVFQLQILLVFCITSHMAWFNKTCDNFAISQQCVQTTNEIQNQKYISAQDGTSYGKNVLLFVLPLKEFIKESAKIIIYWFLR